MKTNWKSGLLALCLAWTTTAGAASQPVLYYTPPDEGFIWDWLLSFKHPFPYSYLGATMEYDALTAAGGERKVQPAEGMPAGQGSNWQAYHHEVGSGWTGAVVTFPPASMYMTYAVCYLVCDKEHRNLSLRSGSDDALLVVLNGEVVQKVQMQRGYGPDQDRVDGLTLKQGWNTLLCKVDDYGGGHGLCARFKTGDDKPFTDYKVVLVPEPKQGVSVVFLDGKKYEADATQLLKQAVTQKTVANDAAASLATAREVVSKFPASKAAAEALYLAGKILQEQGKADEAIATFDRLSKEFPFAKWAEDSLVAKAQIASTQNRAADAVAALETLVKQYEKSALVPEAMLLLAEVKSMENQFVEAGAVLEELRANFPQTVESVKALDKLADNKLAAGDRTGAVNLWQQVIDESDALSKGKYVWYVNVQATLKGIADHAREKKEAKK